jgi:hypothetical protein
MEMEGQVSMTRELLLQHNVSHKRDTAHFLNEDYFLMKFKIHVLE